MKKSSEEGFSTIEEVKYIDGISQAEQISTINLDVKVEDGMLVFDDHKSFINAMDILASSNVESIIAWGERIGFRSLFTEFLRIASMETLIEKEESLKEGRLSKILEVRGDGVLDMPLYSFYLSRVLNVEGLVKVSGYVGTVGAGLTIWTKPENKQTLMRVLDEKITPNPDIFEVFDDSYFSGVTDAEFDERTYGVLSFNCPTGNTFSKEDWFTEGDRSINAKMKFEVIDSPASNGNRDYTCKFIIEDVSWARCCLAWWPYKTFHEWGMNITFKEFLSSSPERKIEMSGTWEHTQTGGHTETLASYNNVSHNFLFSHGIKLINVLWGPTSPNGPRTFVTHRGMGSGNEVVFMCF